MTRRELLAALGAAAAAGAVGCTARRPRHYELGEHDEGSVGGRVFVEVLEEKGRPVRYLRVETKGGPIATLMSEADREGSYIWRMLEKVYQYGVRPGAVVGMTGAGLMLVARAGALAGFTWEVYELVPGVVDYCVSEWPELARRWTFVLGDYENTLDGTREVYDLLIHDTATAPRYDILRPAVKPGGLLLVQSAETMTFSVERDGVVLEEHA